MPDRRLIEYVYTQLKNGYSVERIIEALRKQGWSEKEIQEGIHTGQMHMGNSLPSKAPTNYPTNQHYQNNQPFNQAQTLTGQQSQTQPTTQQQTSLGLFGKMKKSLSSPTYLFNNVKQENLSSPFKYYAVISLIPLAILLIIFLLAFSVFSPLMGSVAMIDPTGLFMIMMLLGPVLVIVEYILGLIGSLIGAGIYHIIAKIYGVKGTYDDTYKAVAYSATPASLLFIVAIGLFFVYPLAAMAFVFVLAIWGLYLQIKGLSVLHDISFGKALLIILTPIIIIGVIVLIIGMAAFGAMMGAFILS